MAHYSNLSLERKCSAGSDNPQSMKDITVEELEISKDELQILPPNSTEENQKISPQNMSLWASNYFELKAIEKSQMQEGFSAFLHSTYKQSINFQ